MFSILSDFWVVISEIFAGIFVSIGVMGVADLSQPTPDAQMNPTTVEIQLQDQSVVDAGGRGERSKVIKDSDTAEYTFRGRIVRIISEISTTGVPEVQYEVQVTTVERGKLGQGIITISDLNCRIPPSSQGFEGMEYLFVATYNVKYEWYNCSLARGYQLES